MKTTVRKSLILAAKLLVAGVLGWYVLGKVHWHDYAVTPAGAEVAVLASRPSGQPPVELKVLDGAGRTERWVKVDQFRPVLLRMPDGAEAAVIGARPDWEAPADFRIQLSDGRRLWIEASAVDPVGIRVIQRGFRRTLASADRMLLAAAFVLFGAPVIILAVRWWYLLRIQHIDISLWESVRLTFLGTFFNFVVPGSVSGDLVKAWYASRHTDRKAAALLSVFVDRVVGLLEFAVLPAAVMAVMFAAGVGDLERLAVPAAIVAAVLVAVVAALAVLLSPGLRRVLHLSKVIVRLPLQRQIALAAEAARLYRRRLGALVKALGLTFGGQTLFITAIMLTGFSLALPVPWYQYFLYVPLIYIIAAVPISPGGLGLAEAFFVTFFSPAGAAPSEILALALTVRLIPMIWSLPGLVVALTGPKRPPAAAIQAELDAPEGD